MVHYTYWIIDNVNRMYYHGVHTSKNPQCIRSYHGSSNALNRAIKLHGIENFTKRVERVFETRAKAVEWERKVHIRLNVAENPKFYNMVNGHPYKNFAEPGQPLSEKHLAALTSETARRKLSDAKRGKKLPHTPEWNCKISEAKKGKKFTEAHKQAIKEASYVSEKLKRITSERIKATTGTSNHARIANKKALVFQNVKSGDTFYVLNMAEFGRQKCNTEKISSHANAVLRGERSKVKGYSVRYSTELEDSMHRLGLLQNGAPYVKLNED